MEQEYYNNQGPSQGRPIVPFPSAATSINATPLPPGTPNTDRSRRDPFGEGADASSSHQRHASSNGPANPFSTPGISRPTSSYGSSSIQGYRSDEKGQRFFHSRRVPKGEVEKPWLGEKNPKEKWVTIFPLIGILVGLGISGFLVWDGLRSVVHHSYCPVMDEDFSSGLDSNIWTKEIELGGFGNGEFAMTTGGDENVFIENGHLIIKATLQDAEKIEKDTVMNLLADGTCTSDKWINCVAATNTTAGNASIVPPAKTGRINTKKGASIKYGRVEVTAKLPKGDWLWPAIWMMPVKDTYGVWPASGEIDILESRGNNWTYAQGGDNIMSSALHWGPDAANDAWWKTNNKNQALHTTFSSGYNTFGLEWSQKYLFTYVNSRLMQVMYVNFNTPMWDRQAFSQTTTNGSRIIDTWSQTGNKNTPFDQKFYLILNLAVGGTNGWFEDGKSGKPWLDQSPNAKKDFWNARETWMSTWERPQMEIKRVVMMQQCDGNEEL